MWYYMFPDTEPVKDLPYYLYSIGQHELQPRIRKPEGDESDQFFYNTRGDGTLILNGQSFHLPEGCGFFIPAGVPHEYFPNGDYWDVRWMTPRGDRLADLYQKLGLRAGVYTLQSYARLEHQIYKMREALLNDPAYGIHFASSLVLEYIIEFAKQSAPPHPVDGAQRRQPLRNSTYQRHMNAIRDYVQYHFMTRIPESELCALVGVTPQHLCRILRTCTGMSPTEYINHFRIKKAKEYLRNTDQSASEIARWCGFANNNYFCRVFKKETSLSPCEYRKQYQGRE